MRKRFLTLLTAALLASVGPAFAAGGGGGGGGAGGGGSAGSGASAGAGPGSAGASTGGTAQGAGTTTGGTAEQPGTGQGAAPDTNTQTTGQSITGLPPSSPTETQAKRNQGAGTAPNGQPIGSPGSGQGSPEQPLNSGAR
jgi:hypothetical protein